MENIEENFDYDKIMSDRKLFNEVVYTPLSEAIRLLEERQKDPELMKKVEELLNGDIPEVLKNKKCGVLGRHIATPNYENRVFIEIANDNNILPVFFEYSEDKFTSNNNYKHSLCQLKISHTPYSKNKIEILEKINIIDFNKYNGKKFKEIKTIWGEYLIDFHRKLFKFMDYKEEDFYTYDISSWYKKNGPNSKDFYEKFLLLFVCYGILFENFLVSRDSEGEFTKNNIIPAIQKVIKLTGKRPLIVPIPPMDMENDDFWYCHVLEIKKILNNQ